MNPTDRYLEELDRELADRLIREIKTAAPERTRAAATATDCKESTAMSTISGAHEEVSIYGTGIAHIPLIGRPEFAGLTFDAAYVPTATVKDGALTITTDDIDLLIGWRNAFQQAIAAMNIQQQRQEGRP
jgi:hypothetical protein